VPQPYQEPAPYPQAYAPPPAGSGVRVSGGVKIRALPLIGAVAIAVSAALPWIPSGGLVPTQNGFDVPFQFLFDPEGTVGGRGGVTIGVALVLLGVIGGLLTFVPITGAIRRAFGGIAIAMAGAYMAQWARLLGDSGGGASFTDVVGFGAYVALAGGVLLAAGR
jgi:hypothetical protein